MVLSILSPHSTHNHRYDQHGTGETSLASCSSTDGANLMRISKKKKKATVQLRKNSGPPLGRLEQMSEDSSNTNNIKIRNAQ